MKTLTVILSVIIISWFCYAGGVKTKKQRIATISSVHISDGKKTFVPITWQTKWFYKDLNSRLKLNDKKGC